MKIERNARGIWEIRWSEGRRSRRKSTGTRDKRAAEQVLAEWLRREGQTPPGDPSVEQVLQRYLNGHARHSTADPHRIEVMAGWLTMELGPRTVRGLTDLDFHRYISRRRRGDVGQRPAKDSTIQQELSCFRTAVNYAVKVGLLTGADRPHVPSLAPPPTEYHWLAEHQVDALLRALLEEDAGERLSRAHRFTVLALATGARKASIEQLTWAQVEWQTGLLRYDLQIRRSSKKRKVASPIPDWLVPYLDRMQREAISEYVLDHPGDIRHAFEWAMKRITHATGDSVYIRLNRHSLRHTCATLMLRAGATIWQVAGVLGDSPETVAKTYGHHAQDHLRQAANSWKRVS